MHEHCPPNEKGIVVDSEFLPLRDTGKARILWRFEGGHGGQRPFLVDCCKVFQVWVCLTAKRWDRLVRSAFDFGSLKFCLVAALAGVCSSDGAAARFHETRVPTVVTAR